MQLTAALTLGAGATSGHLTVTAETIRLGAAINTDGGSAGGNVTLNGNLVLTADVAIDTNVAGAGDGVLTVAGAVQAAGHAFRLNVGATSLALNDPANDLAAVTVSSAHDASLVDTTGFTFTGSSAVASLAATSNGPIGNAASASLAVAEQASLTGLSIALGNAAGDEMNFGSLTCTSAGAVSIAEDSSTLLAGSSTAASLTLSSTDALANNVAAHLAVTGNAHFSGPSIALGTVADDEMQFGSLTFTSAAPCRSRKTPARCWPARVRRPVSR